MVENRWRRKKMYKATIPNRINSTHRRSKTPKWQARSTRGWDFGIGFVLLYFIRCLHLWDSIDLNWNTFWCYYFYFLSFDLYYKQCEREYVSVSVSVGLDFGVKSTHTSSYVKLFERSSANWANDAINSGCVYRYTCVKQLLTSESQVDLCQMIAKMVESQLNIKS